MMRINNVSELIRWKEKIKRRIDPLDIYIQDPRDRRKWKRIIDPQYIITVHSVSRPRDYHSTIKEICGQREIVKRYCAHLFQTDRCTPFYEHMLWQVAEVKFDLHTMYVRLTKTNYAGD